MELGNLIFNEEFIKPYRKEKKGKIIYIIRIDKLDAIDANDILFIQQNLNYINRFENSQNNKKIELKLDIEAICFRDKTVVLILEILLFSLMENIDIMFYLNIRLVEKNSIVHNFFRFSYLYIINRRFISSYTYCKDFVNYLGENYIISENNIMAAHFRKCFFVDVFKLDTDYLVYQQYLSNDIYSTLNGILNNKKILDETCSIVDELVDNILCHTSGFGLIDIGVVKVKSYKDEDEYLQFMINVINVSDNCLYTDIKNIYDENKELKNRDVIEYAYDCQKKCFNTENYTENLFFMVTAFQKGTTTRSFERRGGTGLNKSIINFSKRSQNDIPENLSYVYSGNDILVFDSTILNSSKIGNLIAFNRNNDYNSMPDKKCLSKSVFYFSGTAYNLMFVVKEDDNYENK